MTEATITRPPLGLAMRSLLRADATVLLRNRVSATLSIILPIVIVVATSLGKTKTRLGGAELVKSTSAVNAIGRILFIVLVLLGIIGRTGILGDTLKSISGWSPVGALMKDRDERSHGR